MRKTGLILCRCGPNIGERVGIDDLRASTIWPGKPCVRDHSVLCGEEGREWLNRLIKEEGLGRVVIAGCSPKEHEKTFHEVLRKSGINPYMLQMVNIREHCEWAGGTPAEATAKARDLIRAALERVRHHEEVEIREIDCSPDVAVIGAGAAGIAAALTLSQRGRRITLIEREHVLGGTANILDKIFPAMECASCMMEPALDRVMNDPRIQVLTGAEVCERLGSFGNFTLKVLRDPRRVDTEACLGCGMCARTCPVEVDNEFSGGLDRRKAIYLPYAGCLPHASVVDAERCLRFTGEECRACEEACPMDAVRLDHEPEEVEIPCGAIVLATGLALSPGEAEPLPPNVLTPLQMERMLHPNGPTEGRVLCAGGNPPLSITLIMDREAERNGDLAWMELLKLAGLIHEGDPDIIIRVAGLHDRPMGAWSEVMERLLGAGVMFYRGTLDGPVENRAGVLHIPVKNGSEASTLKSAMAVLHGSRTPALRESPLSKMLGVDVDDQGFVKGLSSPFEPAATRIKGVFAAGYASGPRSLTEAVRDGVSAAGRILSVLIPGEKITLEPLAGEIDAERCSGCRLCATVCPFGAIIFDGEKEVSVVVEEYCRACGTCVASCPSGAAKARHFTDEQIFAELKGLFSTISQEGG